MHDTKIFLLVEDDRNDAALLQRAFARCNLLNPLQVLHTGEETIDYLKGSGRYSNRAEFPLPSIVLLDLKLPGLDGFEVLRWMRGQPELQKLRVIVLTSSESIHDVNLAYKLGANSFLIKPMDLEHLCRMTEALHGHWLWMDRAPEIAYSNSERKPIPG